jgi:hypothetical protein
MIQVASLFNQLLQHFPYLFTALNPNKIGPSKKGLDKSPRFV